MGCDGGTIPKRDELVKTKKKPEQKDKAAELAFRWQNCALSQAPFQQPIVACELGRLYNKETIIETLLDKSAAAAEVAEPSTSAIGSADVMISHIKSLRDVKALNLTENPDWSEISTIEKGDAYIDVQKSRWICPVSGQEMNGRFRFVFIWSCGCVISEKALKEMNKNKKDGGYECLKCQKPFEMSDVILLNPAEPEDISALQEKMEARRAKSKDLKKSKKNKSSKTEAGPTTTTSEKIIEINGSVVVKSLTSDDKSKLEKRKFEKKEDLTVTAGSSKSNGNGVASAKKSKTDSNTSQSSVSKLKSYSVAKDPNVSTTYKSLFTSSEKGKGQERAHWVTYNPFYN